MCGIAGAIGAQAGETIVAMTRALAHRGPDGEGFHREDGAALGHRRLSIIDIEGGAQPLANEEGKIYLVCNGEIYNSPSLRKELVRRGHGAESREIPGRIEVPDPAVTVHAHGGGAVLEAVGDPEIVDHPVVHELIGWMRPVETEEEMMFDSNETPSKTKKVNNTLLE